MFTAYNILVNPVSGTSHVASRYMIIDSLTRETYNYMNSGMIRFISCYREKDDVFVHIQLASKSTPNLWYDTVFQFMKVRKIVDDKIVDAVFIKDTEMKVFSNSPEFMFTYGHAFASRNLLIQKYKNLMSTEAITTPSIKKNPSNELGMPSALFMPLKFLEIENFFGKYNYLNFINNVKSKPQHFDYLMNKIKAQKNKNKMKK